MQGRDRAGGGLGEIRASWEAVAKSRDKLVMSRFLGQGLGDGSVWLG
jgi:hypothetical protein